MIVYTKKENEIIFNIRVIPNSSKNSFIKESNLIKLKITAPPVDNKANKFIITYLSKQFKIPKTSIKILHGETSKDKTISITLYDNEKIELVCKQIDSIE